jgi:hypothetical protein
LNRYYLGKENVCFVTDVFSIWFTYDYGLFMRSNKFINKKTIYFNSLKTLLQLKKKNKKTILNIPLKNIYKIFKRNYQSIYLQLYYIFIYFTLFLLIKMIIYGIIM